MEGSGPALGGTHPAEPIPAGPARIWPTAKRALDVLLAGAALGLTSPALITAAIAIRLESPGPVIFRQRRLGRDREPFEVLKLRSMYSGALEDRHREYIGELAESAALAVDGLYKLVDDDRVTRVGALLRRTSLDELPQLFNVLRGEMSIVGPRPALEYELVHYRPEHFERFAVKPGLTGLWQVSGRATLGLIEMLDLDVRYVRTAGLRTDLRILARTPQTLLRRDTA